MSAAELKRQLAEARATLARRDELLQITNTLSATLDVAEIYRRAAGALMAHFHLARCTLASWEHQPQTLTVRARFTRAADGAVVDDHGIYRQTLPLEERPTLRQALLRGEIIREEGEEGVSRLVVPLGEGQEAAGVFDLLRPAGGDPFIPAEVEMAGAIAAQVTIALANAALTSEARSRAAQMSTINRINRALAAADDLATIFATIRRELFSLTEATGISLLLLTEDGQHLAWAYGYEYGREVDVGGIVLPLDKGFSGHVARTREPLLVNEDFARQRQDFDSLNVGTVASAWLGVPLIAANEIIGVLALENGETPTAFVQNDVQLLQTISSPVATAIKNLQRLQTIRANQAAAERLYEIGRAINTAHNVHQIVEAMIQTDTLQQAERVTVFIFSEREAAGAEPPVDVPAEAARATTWVEAAATWVAGEGEVVPPAPVPFHTHPQASLLDRDQALLVADAGADERLAFSGELAGYASFAAFPLVAGNVWIGYIAAYAREAGVFQEAETRQLMTLARQAATTLQNQRLLEQTQEALLAQSQQSLQLQTAAEVSAAASSILDVDELTRQAVNLIQQRFGLYYVGLLLLDDEGRYGILRAGTGRAGRTQLEKGFRIETGSRSLVGGALADGQIRIVQDVSQNEEWRPEEMLPSTRAELALPLKVRERIIGALSVQSASVNDFPPSLVSILQTMSEQLAIAVDNARLLAQAEARARRQQLLHQVSTRLHSSADVETIIGIGLQALSEQLGGGTVHLTLGHDRENGGEEEAS